MSEVDQLVQAAVSAAATATGADLVRVVDASSPIAHEVAAEITRQGVGPWVEADGAICIRIPGTTGSAVWDGLTYAERRRAAFQQAFTRDQVQEALFEAYVEDRPQKLNELQAIREAIKTQYPKPEVSDEQ